MTFETSPRINKWMQDHVRQGCITRATAGEQFVFYVSAKRHHRLSDSEMYVLREDVYGLC